MATSHNKTYIWDSSVRLSPYGVHSGVDITIQNLDSVNPIYLGGENVNSNSFGYRLAAGTAVSFELPGKDAIYAYSDYEVEIAVLMTGLEVGN